MIRVGDGRLLYSAGHSNAALALASGRLPPEAVTSVTGGALSAEELPYAAARAGRVYPARALQIDWEGSTVTVVASVLRARAADGTDGDAAFVVLEAPTEHGAAETREKFVTIATHELKSPIASLQLDLERLRRRLSQTETVRGAEVAKNMERALRQVTRLTLLIQNLLDVSRMQAHQFTLSDDEDERDLCAIVTEMVETLRPQAAAAGCDLQLTLCAPIVGRWDQLRLEQVLHNLVSNALKYARSGKRIELCLEHDHAAHRARLIVRDHGPGVPEKDRSRIFEPFERGGGDETGDAATTNSLGLGLYIVREIVAAHGGAVRLEHPAGGGASFIVDLPIKNSECQQTS